METVGFIIYDADGAGERRLRKASGLATERLEEMGIRIEYSTTLFGAIVRVEAEKRDPLAVYKARREIEKGLEDSRGISRACVLLVAED